MTNRTEFDPKSINATRFIGLLCTQKGTFRIYYCESAFLILYYSIPKQRLPFSKAIAASSSTSIPRN